MQLSPNYTVPQEVVDGAGWLRPTASPHLDVYVLL